jgi:cytochrome c oxidase assembly factor CtaG
VSAYSFHLHPGAWIAIAVIGLLYGGALRLTTRRSGQAVRLTVRQRWALASGLAALVVALTWPVADLAAHWSLTALVVQRLLLTLAAAPMLLLALPSSVIATVTRPAPVDRALEVVTRPVVAVVVFTVVAVATLLTPAVAAQASSGVVRALFDSLLLVGGFVLWGPVLRHIPGASRPSPIGLAAYLFVQSVVPGFASVIYVFAHHPLYPAFAHAHAAFGLSPVTDQQVAGVVAKVATLPVLWSVAWVALTRAAREDTGGTSPDTLTWAEVERQLLRAERLQARGPRRHHPGRAIPRPRVGIPPGADPPEAEPPVPGSSGEDGGG